VLLNAKEPTNEPSVVDGPVWCSVTGRIILHVDVHVEKFSDVQWCVLMILQVYRLLPRVCVMLAIAAVVNSLVSLHW